MAKFIKKKTIKKSLLFGLFLGIAFLGFAGVSYAQNQTIPIPTFRFGVEGAETPQDVAFSLQVVFIFTILALAPSIIMVMTSFKVLPALLLYFLFYGLLWGQLLCRQTKY